MSAFKTPGVYITEISSRPGSISQVATAIPAFIGLTEKDPDAPPPAPDTDGDDPPANTNQAPVVAARKPVFHAIRSLDDYEALFGKGVKSGQKQGFLYSSMKMFFTNGGGPAYVCTIGDSTKLAGLGADPFVKALTVLEKETEPTLIVFPDAVLLTATDRNIVYGTALRQCEKFSSRFCIFDVPGADVMLKADVGGMRDDVGTEALGYGAAYGPWLRVMTDDALTAAVATASNAVTVTTAALTQAAAASTTADTAATAATGDAKVEATKKAKAAKERKDAAQAAKDAAVQRQNSVGPALIPPSGAIAGVFSQVDARHGVWKAPANIGLTGVVGPTENISDEEQENLNVDSSPAGGKSINCIRSFPGKGTLVWGARTLDGGSNDWRYVSVRRLFIMIEESVRRAMKSLVFESNDANTWIKAKAMIENFVSDLWRQGALAGAKPEQAYRVSVGATTMSPEDIDNGIMRISVELAAVRPAEFIVINFAHKMQQL